MPSTISAPTMASHKVLMHPERVRGALLDPRHTPPITLDVDTTTACNSRCPNCTFPDTGRMFLDFDLYKRTIEEVSRLGVKAITFTGGGEPTLHPRFMEMIETAKAHGLEIGLITNGLAFSPEIAVRALPLLNWVRFSLDAGSSEMYRKTHGLNEKAFVQLTENIETAVKLKRDQYLNARLGASYLILESDPPDFRRAVELGQAIGLDYLQFKPMQLHDPSAKGGYKYNLDVIREAEKHLRPLVSQNYGEAFHVYFTRFCPQLIESGPLEYRQSPTCFGQRFTTSLAADGRLYACCHYKYDPDFELGNLYFDSFETIWSSERRIRFLEVLNPIIKCLQGCKLENLNERKLDAAGNLEKMRGIEIRTPVNYPDPNFI